MNEFNVYKNFKTQPHKKATRFTPISLPLISFWRKREREITSTNINLKSFISAKCLFAFISLDRKSLFAFDLHSYQCAVD